MIFGPPTTLGLPSPHRQWFKEAIERFWWNWSYPDAPTPEIPSPEAPYKLRGPRYPFDTLAGPYSGIDAINARTTVAAGSVNKAEIYPDQHGVSAFITLDPVGDERLFSERAVALTLSIAVFVFIEDPRFAQGDEADLCAMFGQPPTAWATGPPDHQVRYAVIELLKELGADPDLIKYRNRSALKLQTSPPSMRVGRPWVPSGRAKFIDEFGPRMIGYPPEDGPLFPVKQPVVQDGLFYDTIPTDAYSLPPGGGTSSPPAGQYFHEVAPPEWPEFLDEFTSHYSDTPGRGSWPTVSLGPSSINDTPPPPVHGGVEATRLVDSTVLGGGQTRRLLYEGEFDPTEAGGGDFMFGIIPWAGNHGYRFDFHEADSPWGEVHDHVMLVPNEDDPRFFHEVIIGGYTLDWFRIDVTVFDAHGRPSLFGGGFKDEGGGGPSEVVGLTDLYVRGSTGTTIGMFEADRLPMSLVKVEILTTTINVFDEDDQHLEAGGGGTWTLDHYVFPDTLMPVLPPWPRGARTPGNIAVGPGFRGSHPTVKGLRGGRVVGSHREWPI